MHDGAPPAADISENYACKVQHRAAEFKSSLADVAPTKAVTVKAKKIRICSTKGIRNEITKHLYHIDSAQASAMQACGCHLSSPAAALLQKDCSAVSLTGHTHLFERNLDRSMT